jgi:hypothetical protein
MQISPHSIKIWETRPMLDVREVIQITVVAVANPIISADVTQTLYGISQ